MISLPGGYSGTYCPSRSESLSSPRSFSWRIAAAVNCFVIEPISKIVFESTCL